MKAAFFEAPGLANLKVGDFLDPRPGPGEVLVRVKYFGINPVDIMTIEGFIRAQPMPHVPGAEFVGVVEDVGLGVSGFAKGDPVVVYNRLYCGSCRYCLTGETQLCTSGGIIGIAANGGFAEYVAVPAKNLVKVGGDLLKFVGLPVGGLTAYNMLRRTGVQTGDVVAVVGATGNVGVFAVQLAKRAGAYVIAISRKGAERLRELGADEVLAPEDAAKRWGNAVDVVVDPVGASTFELSLKLLARGGRYVTAGALTGGEVEVDLRRLYGAQLSLVGSTGGRRADLEVLVRLVERGAVSTPIYRLVKGLDGLGQAIEAFRDPGRIGKVAVEV
ncbi:MAG: alcohol dehydrogenase catalytic domain-containing protein [Thermoproteus sp. AZ2]|uniref:Alcohol dehydrogenase catalytic domain-containing protein n=1 Tax=Thermoproteus sp. AZ2 TaxID=1609232 RepID=A0ACC6UZ10_9CREN|nr:MAG: alcohol dehydrogenase [Thermoproteus sp. AZ2]